MSIKTTIKSILFATLFVAFVFTSETALADSNPPVQWRPATIETTIFRGAERTIEIALFSTEEIEEVKIDVAPELSPFVKVLQKSFDLKLPREATSTIQLLISAPPGQPVESIEGTIKIRQSNKVIAKPLPLILHVKDPEPATHLLEDYLIGQFGTTSPSLTDTNASIILPQDIIDSFSEGSDVPLVFKSGSLRFLGPWAEEKDADVIKNNIQILLSLLQEKAVNTRPLLTALETTVYVRDDPKKTVLPCGADATNFYPFIGLGLIPIDTDCDNRADTYVLLFETWNYTVFRPDYLDVIKNGPLFEGDANKKILNLPAKIALHELTHATSNITICNSRFWFNAGLDENYTRKIEDLFYWIIPYQGDSNETIIINNLYQQAKDLISPNLNCLEILNIIPPAFQGSLSASLSGTPPLSVLLSWIPSTDNDFESYRVYRSLTSGAGVFGQLIAVMLSQINTGPNEPPEETVGIGVSLENLQPETTYYYSVFIFDKMGLTAGSNELPIITPENTQPPPPQPEDGGDGDSGGDTSATSTPPIA